MRTTRLWAIVGAMLILAGCAPLPKQAYNREASDQIKTLVLAQAPNQTSYEAAVIGHPASSFGLIGGLIAAADIQYKSGKLTDAVNAAETRLQDRFSAKLAEMLTQAGYEPTVFVVPAGTKDNQIVDLAKRQKSCDAVVTVMLVGGYWAAGASTDYVPRLFARVRAVDAKSDKTLYEDTFTYGYTMPQAQTVHTPSDPQYRFADIDALVADPAKARRGWYEGVDAIVAHIAEDLKRK